jgi:hypothetical protein
MIYIFFNFKQLACKCDINSFNYLQIVHTSRQPTHIHTHTPIGDTLLIFPRWQLIASPSRPRSRSDTSDFFTCFAVRFTWTPLHLDTLVAALDGGPVGPVPCQMVFPQAWSWSASAVVVKLFGKAKRMILYKYILHAAFKSISIIVKRASSGN